MKVIVLHQAREGFKRSLRYLSAHYDKRYLKGLKRKVVKELRWLGDNPGAGQVEPELEWMNAGYRRLVVGPFKIVYRIMGNTIVVNDIFDARRDPERMKP